MVAAPAEMARTIPQTISTTRHAEEKRTAGTHANVPCRKVHPEVADLGEMEESKPDSDADVFARRDANEERERERRRNFRWAKRACVCVFLFFFCFFKYTFPLILSA